MAGCGQRAAAQAASTLVGQRDPQTRLKITLRMYNYGVSQALLAKAEREAATILHRAGVGVAWVDCPLSPADSANYPTCLEPVGTTDFAVKVLAARETERFSSHHDALGQALECSRKQAGCAAYVFYRDVLQLAREGDAAEYQLLGHALAHEVGHLLLGPNSHSPTGIMRANWSRPDVQMMARAYLFFTEEQSRRLRDEVLARNASGLDQVATAGKP
jgi:hypothetical protein